MERLRLLLFRPLAFGA